MRLWDRLAREKIHFFWTLPIVNFLMLVTANLGVIYLVLREGRWEALAVIPLLFVAWLVLWLVGRKRMIRNEVDYNWRLSRSWGRHERKTEEMLERLERLEAGK